MSLAILLGGWVAASIILSPLIGRFLAGTDKGETERPRMAAKTPVSTWAGPRHAETMRRNVAIQLYRRQAGWPRTG
jgi:hypothetical protein